MAFSAPRPLRPGESPRPADFNAMAEALAAMGESSTPYGGDLAIDRSGGGGIQVNDHATGGHWAKITGVTTGLYSHVEVTPDGVALPTGQGYYGTAETNGTPAREVNGQTAPTDTVVWLELDSFRTGWVFSLGSAGDAGFYASLSGSANPYDFAEVAGPAVGSATVAGGRASTSTDKAYEQLTALAGIPAGTVVWMYAGTTARPWRFNCFAIKAADGRLEAGSATCSVKAKVGVVAYVSASRLCGNPVALLTTPEYVIPSTCVSMVTGGSIACVSGVPVLTLTTTNVRVLNCGAC